jgi:hypothetical protein
MGIDEKNIRIYSWDGCKQEKNGISVLRNTTKDKMAG